MESHRAVVLGTKNRRHHKMLTCIRLVAHDSQWKNERENDNKDKSQRRSLWRKKKYFVNVVPCRSVPVIVWWFRILHAMIKVISLFIAAIFFLHIMMYFFCHICYRSWKTDFYFIMLHVVVDSLSLSIASCCMLVSNVTEANWFYSWCI